MKPLRSTVFVSLRLLILGFAILPGCHQDPAVTVHIEINGISDKDDRDDVQEALKGMTDGSGHQMTSQWSGNHMSIDLSPVSDVDAFSKKITFGKVTAVDIASRTVKVDFGP